MKLAIDLTVLSFNREGIGNYLRALLVELDKLPQAKQFWLMCTPESEAEIVNLAPNLREQIVVVPAVTRGLLKGFRQQWALARAAQRIQADVVISTHSHLLPLLSKRCWWLIHDFAVILHPQYFGVRHSGVRERLAGWLQRRALGRAEKILLSAEFNLTEAQRFLPEIAQKCVVIGIGPDAWALASENQREFSARNNRFLVVGTVSPRKNYVLLLQAYRLYLAQTRAAGEEPWPLQISGKLGWQVSEFQQELATFSDEPLLQYGGYLPDAELIELSTHSKVLVYPSLYEGFGIPVLNAVLTGAEVLAADIPVFRQSFGEALRYFDPLSAEALASQLREVSHLQHSQVTHFRQQLAALYNWKDVATNLVKLTN